MKDDFYDKLHDVLKWEADNQKVVLICDFNADINPWERVVVAAAVDLF